jgi:hypothetical protein
MNFLKAKIHSKTNFPFTRICGAITSRGQYSSADLRIISGVVGPGQQVRSIDIDRNIIHVCLLGKVSVHQIRKPYISKTNK